MASTSSSPDPLQNALARVAELEEALRASNQELQHFVYAASHDLQEPLRAITTYSQLLERQYASDPHGLELIAFIKDGVVRMTTLLQSLLVYSRMNPAPALRNVNLDAPLQEVLFKLSPLVQATGATISRSELPEITANEAQISQLFEQIISNSLIYRRDVPEIEISSEEREIAGEIAQVVRIKDNGVGIEQQFISQVIQPFKRLHSKQFPGNGLGLAICDKIMRAHNGKLWLESDGATGTIVYLAFPI